MRLLLRSEEWHKDVFDLDIIGVFFSLFLSGFDTHCTYTKDT